MLDALTYVQDDLYALLPVLSILELVIILLYLGHISGCFFYLMSTPTWQTEGGAVQALRFHYSWGWQI